MEVYKENCLSLIVEKDELAVQEQTMRACMHELKFIQIWDCIFCKTALAFPGAAHGAEKELVAL